MNMDFRNSYGVQHVAVVLLTVILYCGEAGGGEFQIGREMTVYVPGQSRVHQTAISEMVVALGVKPEELKIERSANAKPGSIFVGMLSETAYGRELILTGVVNLHNIPPDIDAFELVIHNNVLWILGSNPRGMLHGVYQLQESIIGGEKIGEDFHRHGEFSIPRRLFHQRFDNWPGTRADVRYISRIGATHCLVTHDWQGDMRHFSKYVPSDIFPKAIEKKQVEEGHRDLRGLIDHCLDYGLEAALWITELPCQGGPWVSEPQRDEFLTRYPAEVFSDSGTYEGKVLCFGHPMVQEYYRQLEERFFREFPEVTILFVFGLDSGGEFCDPEKCGRCRGMNKFEQRDRFLRFLLEEGRKVQSKLQVLTTSWGWETINYQEFLNRQRKLPEGIGLYMPAQYDGWQAERQNHEFLRQAREICRSRNQLFIGYDDFHWGDDTVHNLSDIQDFPLGIAAKIARWNRLGVDGVFDHWGTHSEDISTNSIACREFFLNSHADPETVCRRIAKRQFGDQAGEQALASWRALEQAHQILSSACTWSPGQWPGWYDGREYAPIPEDFTKHPQGMGLPPKPAWGWTYNGGALANQCEAVGETWRRAWPNYQKAINLMQQAIDQADDQPLGYAFWWSGQEKSPTRREHLRRQKLYQESMVVIGREIGLHFSLRGLYERLGGDAAQYRQQAESLLREDAEACRTAVEFLKRQIDVPKPNSTLKTWCEQYQQKADAIDRYLNAVSKK
jgi:hypothetical protein